MAIGQLEVVDLSLFDNMRDELFEVMEQIQGRGGKGYSNLNVDRYYSRGYRDFSCW